MMNALEFNHVWKKFKKGERFDSLRDLIPTMARSLFPRGTRDELQEKEFWAVKDVSFEVKRGQILGIIGPNGAGKSTILKLLSGIFKPTRGDISINGRLSALIEVGAGFHNDLTGRENIFLNGTIMGMKKEEIERKFDSIVAFSELEEFIDTPVKRYSSGMYVRLGFSVAAHLDPEILLIDEVLSVGDFRFQRKCMQKMNEFIRNGTTIIFISHNLPSVVELCPQTILLHKGQVQEIGESRTVVHDYYKAWSDMLSVQEGGVEVRSVRILNSQNKPALIFKAGETVTLQCEFVARKDITDAEFTLILKREDGLVLFDANSFRYAHKRYQLMAGQTALIEAGFRVTVPAGLYYLGISLKQGQKLFVFDDEIIQFHVEAPQLSAQSYTFIELDLK